MGHYLEFKETGQGMVNIFYGREAATKKLEREYYCGMHPPYLSDENEDFIFIANGCGTSCIVGYLVPLDDEKEPIPFQNWVKMDLKNNFILTLPPENDKRDVEVFRTDTFTSERFPTQVSCPLTDAYSCVDRVEVKAGIVTLYWNKAIEAKPFQYKLKPN